MFLILTALLGTAALPHAAIDTTAPIQFAIDGSLVTHPGAVAARATIRLRREVLRNPSALHLGLARARGRRLHITRLTDAAGHALAGTFAADSGSVRVALPMTGAVVTVIADYTVPIDTLLRKSLGYTLFQSTDTETAWYPVVLDAVDSLARFRDFDVALDVPREYAFLATGPCADSAATGGGVRHRCRARHIEGFALAYGTEHVVHTVARGGIRVRVLSPLADTATFRRVADETAKAAAWYRETYGFFPVEEIGIVPGSQGPRGGFPLPNVFMIHRGDLSAPFVRWITAHELAHYYWGLYVLDDRERLGWLSLALGIWTDQAYLSQTAGVPLAAQWRDVRADNSFEGFMQASVAGYDRRLGLPAAEADSLPYDYHSLVRHAKAATGVYLLSLHLGARRFIELQRQLLAKYRYRELSPEAFGAELEAAGVPSARAFLRAWAKGDAQLGYAVRSIRREQPASFAYWIRVERTGTIPFPVTIETRSARGEPVRSALSGDASLDSVRVELAGPFKAVRIDPDGLLPMATSDHLDMRRVYLRALGAAGPPRTFLALVTDHLQADPDPVLATLAVERLFELGRSEEIRALAARHPGLETCADRRTCLAAAQVARSYVRLGAVARARALLEKVEPALGEFGLTGSSRLTLLRQELQAHRAAARAPATRSR